MERVLELKESVGAITSPEDLFERIRAVKVDFNQENVLLFCLDTKNRLIDCEVLFKGGLNATLIDPRTIFRRALMQNASSIIVGHNHPSGDLAPSEEDRRVFECLQRAGDLLGLPCLDSVIFNQSQFYSMKEH